MLKKIFFWGFVLVVQFVIGQTKIKTVFYNLLQYDNNQYSRDKTPSLKIVLDELNPDLFLVCELKNEAASDYLFTHAIKAHNFDFEKAIFRQSQSPATDLLQMAYYNSKKLILQSTEVIPTGIRDINHYTFKLNTDDESANSQFIEVYVTHLKASTGPENRLKRLQSAEIFARELDRISPDSFVIFAGDFNFYSSNEEGYQKILDKNNAIQLIDPIDRPCLPFPENIPPNIDPFTLYASDSEYFWRNSSFSDIHSQSTRNGSWNGEGSGGGMDDRFDFILLSNNFLNSSNLFYVTQSYQTIGNNGNCYNSYVSNPSCTGGYSAALRNALFDFSDHLPIYLEIESPANTLSTQSYNQIKFISSNVSRDFIEIHPMDFQKEFFIYNHLGQVIHKLTSEEEKIRIDIRSYPQGLYFIRAKNSLPKKFIKL